MGTWPLWIGFNAGVALLLLTDLFWFHRHAETISLREAAFESVVWISLSLGFGAWIYASHGRGPGLEFFTGYLVEKSLSTDNIFVFLLVFHYFRVAPRFQHRLLYWGVMGAIVMRGVMIAAGTALIERFAWVPYLLGVFLLYSGFQLFGADHAVHPEKNLLMRWAQKIVPMSEAPPTGDLLVREGGRWLFTSLFLVVIVLETTDLILAVDSIAAVFGVTRDPFLVYSSNICAVLGLRALYFLLAGILPYFQYLDEGLAITVMFVGAKMLAEPWLHVPTGLSLAIVGGIIAASVLISVLATKRRKGAMKVVKSTVYVPIAVTPELIGHLAHSDAPERAYAASRLFYAGLVRVRNVLHEWEQDEELRALMVPQRAAEGTFVEPPFRFTTGIAVLPGRFYRIRSANGSPPLADAPADQDVLEFELEFSQSGLPNVHLDILTTNAPDGQGAIARFLKKFDEGIQQVELDVTDVGRATEILRTKFSLEPIYPATRAGANNTRVNFFLVPGPNDTKVLVELVEQSK